MNPPNFDSITSAQHESTVLGRGHPRRDGRERVTGRTLFTADLKISSMRHVRLLLSPLPAARIRNIDLTAALGAPGVICVVHGSSLGYKGADGPDAPLAIESVAYAGQPLAAVVADTEAHAADAIQLIDFDLEPLDPVLWIDEALADGARSVLPDAGDGMDDSGAHGIAAGSLSHKTQGPNVTQSVAFKQGDVDAALDRSTLTIDEVYDVPQVHQGFLEPHVVMAVPEPDGRISVYSPTQGAFFTRREVARVLGLPLASIRVVPMPVGGGFGGKICLLEPLMVLLAKQVGEPVRLELTRTEEFLMGRGGPGCVIRLTLGTDSDGYLTGIRAKIVFDHGATRGALGGLAGLLLGGTYRLPAYDIECLDIATNKTPAAAYRAPGAPQTYFALESAMDDLARGLGWDPITFRLQNAVREGDPRPDGQAWPRIGLVECLEAAARHRLYKEGQSPDIGMGVAVGAWGGGLEPAAVACRVESDGTVVLQLAASDISGTGTTLAMIAAEAFGVSLDAVRVETGDTSNSPYAGISGGSKTILTVGLAVKRAAEEARRQLLEIAADVLEAAPADLYISNGNVVVSGVPSRAIRVAEAAALAHQFGARYEPVEARGSSAIVRQSPMFTVQIAHVRADRETGEWRLTELAAIQDVGRALNPPEVEGQMHGGALQGAGRALGEAMRWNSSGQLVTSTFLDYELPSIDQAPEVSTEFVEVPSAEGPYGAKGVGEPPAVPGPAAIANAIRSATGHRVTALPIDWFALAQDNHTGQAR